MLFSYFSPIFAIAYFNKQLVRNMAAKIQIKNDRINSFGGIFFIIDHFRSSGLAALVDKTMGIKGINTRYSYSNVIVNLTSVFVSGGEVLEDVNFFRQEAFKENPDYRFCSADTIGRDLRGLAVENTEFQAVESGKTYQFSIKTKGLYRLIANNPGISAIKLSEMTGISSSTLNRNLNQLKAKRLITYEGSKKTGGYKVVSSWACVPDRL